MQQERDRMCIERGVGFFWAWSGKQSLAIYQEAKKFRAENNGRVIQEPREMVSFGD
jgi:hypothetical protein